MHCICILDPEPLQPFRSRNQSEIVLPAHQVQQLSTFGTRTDCSADAVASRSGDKLVGMVSRKRATLLWHIHDVPLVTRKEGGDIPRVMCGSYHRQTSGGMICERGGKIFIALDHLWHVRGKTEECLSDKEVAQAFIFEIPSD